MGHDRAEAEAGMALTLARALAAAAGETAKAPTGLVSITCDLVAGPEPNETVTAMVDIVRATRSLIFAQAELLGREGRLLMAATSVHRIVR